MREITYEQIVNAVRECVRACGRLTPSCKKALEDCLAKESGSAARFALSMLIENADTAEREDLAVCQDTGMAVVFVRLWQGAHGQGGGPAGPVEESGGLG